MTSRGRRGEVKSPYLMEALDRVVLAVPFNPTSAPVRLRLIVQRELKRRLGESWEKAGFVKVGIFQE